MNPQRLRLLITKNHKLQKLIEANISIEQLERLSLDQLKEALLSSYEIPSLIKAGVSFDVLIDTSLDRFQFLIFCSLQIILLLKKGVSLDFFLTTDLSLLKKMASIVWIPDLLDLGFSWEWLVNQCKQNQTETELSLYFENLKRLAKHEKIPIETLCSLLIDEVKTLNS